MPGKKKEREPSGIRPAEASKGREGKIEGRAMERGKGTVGEGRGGSWGGGKKWKYLGYTPDEFPVPLVLGAVSLRINKYPRAGPSLPGVH